MARLAFCACIVLLAHAAASPAAPDPLLPPDTESYLALNVKQIVASPVAKKVGVDNLKGWVPPMADLDALGKDLGFDPLKDVDRAQFAAPKGNDTDRGLVILSGRFDADAFRKKAGADGWAAHKVKDGEKDAGIVYELKPQGRPALYAALLDNKTLLASGGKEYVIAALAQARSRKKAPLKDRSVQAVIEKLDARQGITLASKGGAVGRRPLLNLLPRRIKDTLDTVEVFGGGVGFTHEVKFDLVGAARSDDDAEAIRDALGRGARLLKAGVGFLGNTDNKTLQLLVDVLNTVKVGGKGRSVTLTARATADVIGDLFNEKD